MSCIFAYIFLELLALKMFSRLCSSMTSPGSFGFADLLLERSKVSLWIVGGAAAAAAALCVARPGLGADGGYKRPLKLPRQTSPAASSYKNHHQLQKPRADHDKQNKTLHSDYSYYTIIYDLKIAPSKTTGNKSDLKFLAKTITFTFTFTFTFWLFPLCFLGHM
jgi:hypothetical protein